MYSYLNRHLQLKLVAVVVLGIVLAFGAIGWLRIGAEKSGKLEDLGRSGRERVELLAAASANLLIGYDYGNMEALAERVVGQRDVEQVLIRNAAGKVMVRRHKDGAAKAATLVFEAPVVILAQTIGTASIEVSTATLEHEIAAVYAQVIRDQLAYGITLGLLIFFATSRTIVKPITRISDQMKTILEAGFGVGPQALEVSGTDEIAGLGRTFNELNHKVYAAQQQLQQKVDLARSDLMTTNRELQQRSTALEQALAQVERLATTDFLTQLRNRRYFDDRLAADFSRARRYGEPLSLLLLDIDHFKQTNDTWGHAAGDALLQALSQILSHRCRETDVVARLGGDEFAFLLYHTDLRSGAVFAEELLRIVNAHRFEYQGQPLRAGLSIGLACSADGVNSIEGLYGAADMALYEAKRNGRNRVASHAHEPAPQAH